MNPATVERFDDNPANVATFGSWVCVSTFGSIGEAIAYLQRAQSDRQRLRITFGRFERYTGSDRCVRCHADDRSGCYCALERRNG